MFSKLAGWLKDKTANLDGTVKSEPSAVKVEIEEPQYMALAAPQIAVPPTAPLPTYRSLGKRPVGDLNAQPSPAEYPAFSAPPPPKRHQPAPPASTAIALPQPQAAAGGSSSAAPVYRSLTDHPIVLCVEDAIKAIHKRATEQGMVISDSGSDRNTRLHPLLISDASKAPPQESSWPASWMIPSSLQPPPGPVVCLHPDLQQHMWEMLSKPLIKLQQTTAYQRAADGGPCTLTDVLSVADLGQRIFLMVPMRWRGPFARVCESMREISKKCWQADEYEFVKVHQHVPLRNLGAPVTQVTSWMRASQTKPIFFLLALSEKGKLEQLRISCKKAEPGLRRPDADDEVKVEHTKDWGLENDVPRDAIPGVTSQFVVTKHHAYCVVAVRGQALLVKLGGNSNGTHEHMYTDRFPTRVTTMSMCPLDNNIIAFGVPAKDSQDETIRRCATDHDGSVLTDNGKEVTQVIELVNFAQSSRIQTIPTSHEQPLLVLDYSPDSEHLLSVSADCVNVWNKDSGLENKGPGALNATVGRTHRLPAGTEIKLAKVHPAWTSVLIATNEYIEVRALQRPDAAPGAAGGSNLTIFNDGSCVAEGSSSTYSGGNGRDGGGSSSSYSSSSCPVTLEKKWRKDNIQITAACFIAQGNMLAVSDRGDRLLLLNYHGLHAAKRCVLPWGQPSKSLSSAAAAPSAAVGDGMALEEGPGYLGDPPPEAHGANGEPAGGAPAGGNIHPAGGGAAGSSSSSGNGSVHGSGGGVCTVTSIAECPDVVGRCSEEWRSGISQLAISGSRGDVILIKI